MSSKGSLCQKWFRVRIVLAVCATAFVVAYPGFCTQPIIAQEDTRSRSEAGDIECVSYCSATRPGTVVMEVRVRLADRSLSEADLRSKVLRQGLEVTVYSEGFERGLFATVSALKPKALFRARTRSKIPGLENLLITDVATRLDKSTQSFLLMQPATDPGMQPLTETRAGAEWVMIRLEGLDPGMKYTFRVPGERSVATCEAVVCPVERIPAPANRVKRKPKTDR
jgi:hypothetical protein